MAWRRIQGQVSWWHPTDRMNDYKSLSSSAGRSNRLVTVSGSATRDNPGESAAAPADNLSRAIVNHAGKVV